MNAAKRPVTPAPESLQSQPLAPHASAASANRGSHYQPQRILHAGARKAIAFESSVKLTVNLLLAIVATTTIAKLVPYYQSQQQQLAILQNSVQTAEQRNTDLRSRFSDDFDPAQAARVMQEQSGMGYPNQKRVIWESPIESN
ncbi:MAG: hypothetical protein HC800_17615 [Phormidesmis sp. RL_2_1]|nr:hypothetical protein [Phormidesmis sp. RL_2_1]